MRWPHDIMMCLIVAAEAGVTYCYDRRGVLLIAFCPDELRFNK